MRQTVCGCAPDTAHQAYDILISISKSNRPKAQTKAAGLMSFPKVTIGLDAGDYAGPEIRAGAVVYGESSDYFLEGAAAFHPN